MVETVAPGPLTLARTRKFLRLLAGVTAIGLVAGASMVSADTAIHEFRFTGEPGVSTYDWLEARKFVLKQDASDGDKISLSQVDGGLHLQAREQAFGLIMYEGDIPNANHVRVHWGVSDFPEGASYEQGVNNEAIMVYLFFGHEKQPSGSLFIPDSPYFIGFYLCPQGSDSISKPYMGRYFQKSGRYVCVDQPGLGETVVSELDLDAEFKKSFGLNQVPFVSGLSVEVDTTDSGNNGKASAFIHRIEFFE